MQSGIAKRSVVIKGHKTSLSLEDPFWSALWENCSEQGVYDRRPSGTDRLPTHRHEPVQCHSDVCL